MKSLLLLLMLPLQLCAQDLAGVWVGIIHNDSTDLDLPYEVVLSVNKGKISGFSYTNFIVDGRSLTGVKSLTITKRFGKLYVEDDKLVFNNYPFDPPKGVKQLSILELSPDEDILSGRFTTARTKEFGRPVTGHVHLLRKKDLAASKLMEILGGLELAADLSFVKTEMPAKTTEETKAKDAAVNPKPELLNEPTPVKTPEAAKKESGKSKGKKPAAGDTATAPPKPRNSIETNTMSSTSHGVNIGAPMPNAPSAEAKLATRKVELVQTIFFSADSLVLELYDNGYVDGDSVSVMLNGRLLFSSVRLSEKAEKKTIYLTPDMGDSIHLVLMAENLGSIAPNSGLAIINDGKTQHKIAFSGDLHKNAGIVLRRKKPLTQ